jgi:hypothetical protein
MVCSVCEAMAKPLSVASTAVSSTNFAVVDSGEGGKSAVYNKYNNGFRTLPCGLTEYVLYKRISISRRCVFLHLLRPKEPSP